MSDEEEHEHEFVTSDDFQERLQEAYPGIDTFFALMEENPGVGSLYLLSKGQQHCKRMATLSSCVTAMMAEDPRMMPEMLLRQLADELEKEPEVFINLRTALSKIIRRSDVPGND